MILQYKVLEIQRSELKRKEVENGKWQNNNKDGQEQDVNQLLKVRREKLQDLQEAWKRSVPDYKI